MTKYDRLPTFDKDFVRVVIETPRGSAAKFSYDPDVKAFVYSHPLPAGISYPFDWGFIPSTLGEDGDPLDGLVIHQATGAPGLVMRCSLIGSIAVEQAEKGKTERNDRYLLCPQKQDAQEVETTDHIPKELRQQIEQFLEASILGTDKKIKFLGWKDATAALKLIKRGQKALKRRG